MHTRPVRLQISWLAHSTVSVLLGVWSAAYLLHVGLLYSAQISTTLSQPVRDCHGHCD